MTRNQVTACLVAIAVLAVVAVWQRRPRTDDVRGPEVIVPEGTLAGVTAIEIRREDRDGEAVSLRLENGAWIVTSRDDVVAETEHVERLVAAIDGMVGEERARDAILLPEFQLAGDGAAHLVFHSGDAEILHLIVGKRGPRVNRSFVRLDGDDRALLGHAGIHSALGIHGQGDRPFEPDFFIDLHLVGVDPERITAMSVQGPQPWSLVRSEPQGAWRWDPPRDPPPEERQATGKAHSFARTRAATLVGRLPLADHGLDQPQSRAIAVQDGTARALLIGAVAPPDGEQQREERYVTVEDSGWVWRMSSSAIDSLLRPPR